MSEKQKLPLVVRRDETPPAVAESDAVEVQAEVAKQAVRVDAADDQNLLAAPVVHVGIPGEIPSNVEPTLDGIPDVEP